VSQASIAEDKAPEVSTSDRSVRIFGLLVILLIFGAFGGWSAYAMLDSAAVAPGVITVESYRKAVQHLEGGILRELFVREGDMVTRGDLLARLDDTQFSSQLESVRSELGGLRALEARLRAERDAAADIAFPDALVQRAGEDPRLQEFMTTQRQIFSARRADLEGRIDLLQQRSAQLHEQILGLDDQEDKFRRRIDLYNEELTGLRSLFDGGMGDKVRMRAMERELAEVEGDMAAALAERARAKLQIEETTLQIGQARREFLRDVVTELGSVQERLFDAEERERGLADRVARTRVLAPATGRVVDLDVHNVGAVIGPGDRLMDIVPEDELLVVDARVSPQSIDKVYPGLSASVRFTALNTRITPTVDGRVKTVSADRLVDQQTGMPYYLARIEIPEDQIARLEGQPLVPGMPADVMIVTGERTVLQYLLRPLSDALARSMRED
jgi:epimerase transport system membrane fusion protein